jgi:hypothetical protein
MPNAVILLEIMLHSVEVSVPDMWYFLSTNLWAAPLVSEECFSIEKL